jgi:hypothetical protein
LDSETPTPETIAQIRSKISEHLEQLKTGEGAVIDGELKAISMPLGRCELSMVEFEEVSPEDEWCALRIGNNSDGIEVFHLVTAEMAIGCVVAGTLHPVQPSRLDPGERRCLEAADFLRGQALLDLLNKIKARPANANTTEEFVSDQANHTTNLAPSCATPKPLSGNANRPGYYRSFGVHYIYFGRTHYLTVPEGEAADLEDIFSAIRKAASEAGVGCDLKIKLIKNDSIGRACDEKKMTSLKDFLKEVREYNTGSCTHYVRARVG